VDIVKAEAEAEDEDSHYEQLFACVLTASSGSRILSELFKILPSRIVRLMFYVTLLSILLDL